MSFSGNRWYNDDCGIANAEQQLIRFDLVQIRGRCRLEALVEFAEHGILLVADVFVAAGSKIGRHEDYSHVE